MPPVAGVRLPTLTVFVPIPVFTLVAAAVARMLKVLLPPAPFTSVMPPVPRIKTVSYPPLPLLRVVTVPDTVDWMVKVLAPVPKEMFRLAKPL